MALNTTSVKIRPVHGGDAATCRRIRRRAFLGVFSLYMEQELAAAGADAYTEAEFARHVANMPTSVAVRGGEVIGFCTVRRRDEEEAELLWLYVAAEARGEGVGSLLVRHAEALVRLHYPEVARIVLVTGVPEYNQAFYERLGYRSLGTENIAYPAASAEMVKLGKDLS